MTTAQIEPPGPMSPGARNRLPWILALIALLAVVGLGGLALLANRPAISLTGELPPVLVDRAPQRGEEQGTAAPIVLVFDKPMDRKSTEEALSIAPGVPYSVKWEENDTLLKIIPTGEGFDRDATYEVKVGTSAMATNGKNLLQELLFRFKAVGFLEVTQVVPAPDTQDVALTSDITVMFNRPVVPLTAISEQGNGSASLTTSLPQPLVLDPPAKGSGEWLNTSIYVFHPDEPLKAGIRYTARIAAGLSDPSGAVLREDSVWSFSTQPPQVLASEPGDSETNVWLDRVVRVEFNQPMNRESAQAAFSLTGASGSRVAGTFGWPSDATLVFTPTQLLERDVQYTAKVAAGAQTIGGGSATELDYAWQFRTVPPLRVVRTSPSDGQTGVDPYTAMEIYFSAPVDEKTLAAGVFATPPVSPTDVYSYYSSYDSRYVYAFSAGPSASFEVTIKGGIADPWGQQLGEDSVVRFETRALDPEAWLNVPGRFGVYNAYTDTVVYTSFRNVSQLNFELYAISLDEFARLSGPDSWQLWDRAVPISGSPIRAWSIPVEAPLNQRGIRRVPLVAPPPETGGEAGGGGALTPGIYFLRVSSPEQSQFDYGGISRHLLVVANTNLTFKSAEREALVWATDMQSGRPLDGALVALRNAQFSDIGGGPTDADGLYAIGWLEPRDPFETKYAVVGAPGSLDSPFGLALNDWSSGIEGYEFGVPTSYFSDPYNVYIYTEKPLYRPGQTVHFKGILRAEDDARYAIDPNRQEVQAQIFDPNGTEVFSGTLPLNEFGAFNADFTLAEEAALGYYSINALIPIVGREGRGEFVNTYSQPFLVSEYRRPEFQVEVTAAKDEYVQGERIQFDVQANYFFGGAVSGGKVIWTAVSNDFFFDRYRGPGYWDWNDIDYFSESGFGGGNVIASGEGVLDDQGHLIVELPANLDEKAGSQTFSLEATVIDVNDQSVSARVEVIVHKGLFYIGLQPEEYVGTAGQPLQINIRTVNWGGDPYGQANLDVVFYQREWFNVQQQDDFGNVFWTSTFSDTAVFTTSTTTTEGGEAQASFTPPAGGEYRVVAQGRDPDGNLVRSATFVWVSSGEYVSWRQENNDRIQLVADQREYSPGETAKILVPSPFQGDVTALLTVERGRILEYRLVNLRSNSDVIDIPITPDMAPNAFVSIVIVKGVDEMNPVPSFKVGYASFTVNIEQQVLNVTITPDKDVTAGEHYGPRDTVTYTLKVTDFAGKPAQAEVSLGLVDLSVLSLLDDFGPSIEEKYYGERGLGVRTSSALVLSVDRINITFAEEGKGGGGGAPADAEGGFVRQRFPDTAYWNATVTTDANGEAVVAVPLADNLTTWRMRAKAVTKDTLVGQGQVDVISTKDLLIRPVTPRFFVVGDKVNLAAVVHNNTSSPQQVEVTLEGTGIQIDGTARQTVDVPAGDRVRVEWPATVLDTPPISGGTGGVADLTFSARGGGLSDASKPPAGLPPDQRIPIYKFSTPETVGTAGALDLDDNTDALDSITEVIALPRRIDVTQGDLTVQIDPSLASASVEGLTYLEHFPYECTEQTVSRFLPNVLTYRALKELDLADAALEAKLQELVGVGLQRLYNQQHTDGGWGWWVNEKSDSTTSAYVVLGLIKAKEAGFSVDDAVLDRGLDYLRRQIVATTRINMTHVANRQSFILYVLAEAGKPQTDAAVSLYDSKRGLLSQYATAYLALALNLDQPEETSRVNTLLSDLNNAAKLSATGAHWEEESQDYWNWNTDTRSTAIVLDALARLDRQNALAPNVVRWLMVARTAGRWESTQETAWALIALTDWMRATGELKADYSWGVKLNGTGFGNGAGNQESLGDPVVLQKKIKELLLDQANALTIEMKAAGQQTGAGKLYYTAHLETFVPVEEVKSLARGISVARQYIRADDECLEPREPGEEPIACTPVTSAKVGDVLQVRLSIVAPTDLYYVKVEDPFPAGAEAVDTTLKTTSQINEAPDLNRVSPYSYYDGWGWWWFSHTELRDEKAVLFASVLPAGTYEYTYQIRAGLSGTYKVLPSHAEEMYFPEVFGRGDGTLFVIEK